MTEFDPRPSFARRNSEAALLYPGNAKRQDQFCKGVVDRGDGDSASPYDPAHQPKAFAAWQAGWKWCHDHMNLRINEQTLGKQQAEIARLRADLAAARREARSAMTPAPIEPGWYAYSGGRQLLTFRLDESGQWFARFDNGDLHECGWGYIEQALSVWDLVPLNPPDPWATNPAPPAGTRYESYSGTLFIVGNDAYVYRWIGDDWVRQVGVLSNPPVIRAFSREVNQ